MPVKQADPGGRKTLPGDEEKMVEASCDRPPDCRPTPMSPGRALRLRG
jgi:hypothetical protein